MGSNCKHNKKVLKEKYSGEQCKSHWNDKLNPAIKHGEWTSEEDKTIIDWVDNNGCGGWAKLAEKWPERTGKQCQQRWSQTLRFRSDVPPVQVAAQPAQAAPRQAVLRLPVPIAQQQTAVQQVVSAQAPNVPPVRK
jgi:hypothetical protein